MDQEEMEKKHRKCVKFIFEQLMDEEDPKVEDLLNFLHSIIMIICEELKKLEGKKYDNFAKKMIIKSLIEKLMLPGTTYFDYI